MRVWMKRIVHDWDSINGRATAHYYKVSEHVLTYCCFISQPFFSSMDEALASHTFHRKGGVEYFGYKWTKHLWEAFCEGRHLLQIENGIAQLKQQRRAKQ